MAKDLRKLIAIASPPLSHEAVDSHNALFTQAGSLGNALAQMLGMRNGFYAFESALHVFAMGQGADPYNLDTWNDRDLWIAEYAGLADNALFFAEDIFGDQFCIRDHRIWRFVAETGETEKMGHTLDQWAQQIVDNYEVETGYPLARDWQAQHGILAATDRLLPKRPFVLGGAFDVTNLYALDRVKGMRFRGNLARQIKNIPDKSKIKIKVV